MREGAMPSEVRGRAEICAYVVHVGQHSSDHRADDGQARRPRKNCAGQRKRRQSMADVVHGQLFEEFIAFTLTMLEGTSSFRARGTILNSTGSRASDSPSTCA